MPASGDDYLVSYDVGCPRRWRRVFRLLHGYGEWIQLSVFRCRLDPRRRKRMETDLREVIEPAEDRLLIARIDEDALQDSDTASASPGPTRRALVL